MARPEDGHDAQTAGVARRAPGDVHAGQTEHEGGHGLGRRGGGRGHREERPTPRELHRAPAVGEKPEVADPDEAAREDVPAIGAVAKNDKSSS